MSTTAADLWRAVSRGPVVDHAEINRLTAEIPAPPRVGDSGAPANLREAMLLARAAAGLHPPVPTVERGGARLGHVVEDDGTIVPAHAERGMPEPNWPDQHVRDAASAPREYAARLLGSPFRVIARYPERLKDFGTEQEDADFSWPRIQAGVLRELPWPGTWRAGTHLLGRAAAAEESPDREADILPLLDVLARPDWLRHDIALETTCLRHAARVVAPRMERSSDGVAIVWRLGQQIRRVLMESPFLGADAELLNARLTPLLPPSDGASSDSWWPDQFASVDLGEVLALTALARRSRRVEIGARLAAAIRGIAARTFTDVEQTREYAGDVLHVATPHGAPPLLARWLLHRAGVPWFGALPPSAREETLAVLRRGWDAPARVRWILWGIERELRVGTEPRSFESLREWLPGAINRASGEDRVAALAVTAAFVGSGLLTPSGEDIASWLNAVTEPPEWEIAILRTFAERALQMRPFAIDRLRACARRDPRRAVGAAKALLSLDKAGLLPPSTLRDFWNEVPPVVQGDPHLASEFELRISRKAG